MTYIFFIVFIHYTVISFDFFFGFNKLIFLEKKGTYREMIENLLLPLLDGKSIDKSQEKKEKKKKKKKEKKEKEEEKGEDRHVLRTYADFQHSGTSTLQERNNIDRPTLLLCSLDDPLHRKRKCIQLSLLFYISIFQSFF